MQDLFKNKEELLEEWARKKGFFSKAEVMEYGLKSFYLRADRTIRSFCQEGKVRRIDKQECLFRGLRGKMAWYCYVDKGNIR